MLEVIEAHRCFGGMQRTYRHASREIALPMRFSVFMPESAGPVPALFCLAGLTCTEETFMIKAGAQRTAAALGMALIAPDTSPRGANLAGETDAWDFGVGAGFYVDATRPPWSAHYRMYSYVLELRELVIAELSIDDARIGILGHSMGGHGALVLALRNPTLFRSVSAIAPIAAPTRCPWGRKAFTGYLGHDEACWLPYDASALMEAAHAPFPAGILLDQGLCDPFLAEQLMPEAFEDACRVAGQPLTLRRHPGYDHGYWFIATVIEDHLRFHDRLLNAASLS
jgi:S-formylglutathione hydrolase